MSRKRRKAERNKKTQMDPGSDDKGKETGEGVPETSDCLHTKAIVFPDVHVPFTDHAILKATMEFADQLKRRIFKFPFSNPKQSILTDT